MAEGKKDTFVHFVKSKSFKFCPPKAKPYKVTLKPLVVTTASKIIKPLVVTTTSTSSSTITKPLPTTTAKKQLTTTTTGKKTATATTTTVVPTATTAVPTTTVPTTSAPTTLTKSAEKDVTIVKEVLQINPFQKRKGTIERAKLWEEAAEKLKKFNRLEGCSGRYIRERYQTLAERYKRKNAKELKASGISPEYNELDNLMQDVFDLERDSIELHEEEQQKKKQNEERSQNFRKRCLESMKETMDREERPHKRQKQQKDNNHESLISYLRERKEEHFELKRRELDLDREKFEEQKLANERERVQREKENNQKEKMIDSLQSLIESQKK